MFTPKIWQRHLSMFANFVKKPACDSIERLQDRTILGVSKRLSINVYCFIHSYIQLLEFEALLFAMIKGSDKFHQFTYHQTNKTAQIKKVCTSPNDIIGNIMSAPGNRLMEYDSISDETKHTAKLAALLDLNRIRNASI